MAEVWQRHHIQYENPETNTPEIVVTIRRSVHWIITKIQRHTKGMTATEKYAITEAIERLPEREDPYGQLFEQQSEGDDHLAYGRDGHTWQGTNETPSDT